MRTVRVSIFYNNNKRVNIIIPAETCDRCTRDVRQVYNTEQLMIVRQAKSLKTMKDEIISRDISYISHSIRE